MSLLLALLACASAVAQNGAANPCSAHASGGLVSWRVYTDSSHHFCFRYPPSYKPIPNVKNPCKSPKLRDSKTRATIYICAWRSQFWLSSLVASAPTGLEAPPEPVHFGSRTFYYYGPGGGGVSYPDQYFYNLGGKTLSIDFDGPYDNDKTPSAEAKAMEKEVLRSFREF